MAERQFGMGWSYNDDVVSGINNICSGPVVGRVRMVEVVRFRYTRAAESPDTLWWLLHHDGTAALKVWGALYTAGSYAIPGPFVLLPGHTLQAGPVAVTADLAEFCCEWSER
jgi:hypothetical protein